MSPLIDLIGSAKGYGWGALTSSSAFESIATIVAAGSESSVTFSSIPSTFQHLQIRVLAKDNDSGFAGVEFGAIWFNGDLNSNKRWHTLMGDGNAVFAAGATSTASRISNCFAVVQGNSANNFGVSIIDIHDYASTTKNKTVRSFSGADAIASGGKVRISSGLWNTTSAITSITLERAVTTFTAGSTFSLYGIKGA
jgi:hypothetical protein